MYPITLTYVSYAINLFILCNCKINNVKLTHISTEIVFHDNDLNEQGAGRRTRFLTN